MIDDFLSKLFFVPPPRWGEMVLATSKKTQDKVLYHDRYEVLGVYLVLLT